ncbi:MAG TPA: lipocalin-like domain-containing protein [Thermoanaerobaculia bacterium]|nr:lipocalin-like domain-containing protein [Thermoanaerobaculia bacterium]
MDEKLDRTHLLGVWSLVSIRDRLPDGTTGDPPDFGPDPAGHLVYTASGHVSVNFMRRSRPPWRSEESPTDSERAIAAAGYGAYAGRFTLHAEEGFVLHHVEVALIPNRVGRDLKRFYSFSGDLLTLRPPPLVRAGVPVERTLAWRRIG